MSSCFFVVLSWFSCPGLDLDNVFWFGFAGSGFALGVLAWQAFVALGARLDNVFLWFGLSFLGLGPCLDNVFCFSVDFLAQTKKFVL